MNRIKVLKIVLFASLGVIAVRLFFIQIVEHDTWVAKASEEHTMLETITADRGDIYMLDGDEPVAVVMDQTVYSIIIDPAVTDKDELKSALESTAKSYIVADLDEVFAREGLRYYIIAKNVPHSVATVIADEGIAGVWFQKSSKRVYPEGELASGLLGFVNADGLGQYGVEGSLNYLLKGEDGLLKSVSDVNNVALSIGSDNVKIPAKDGKDVVLSIDRGLEKGIEEIAEAALNNSAASNAAVLVMKPGTGEVLAMANLPNYNPDDYGNVKDASAYVNYVTEVPYEPASICKNFAFAAAINEGKMTPETTFYNQGYEIVDGWKIMNAEQRAILNNHTLTMKDGLYWSLNTASIHALKLLGDDPESINQKGREKLYDYYYNKFRLSRLTGIELIEAEGYLEDPNEGWGRDSTYANMTFGQNLGITMIQTATAFSAVINGGYWRTPTVVRGTLENGEIVPLETEKQETKILSDETSAMMREMLINNRGYKFRNGTDRQGYDIGGKSGTAQVIIDGAYDDSMSELVGSYIGFIARSGEMPEYLIMTKMWGSGASIDSGVAMNLFDSLENYLIDYFKIKPNL